MEDTAKGIEVNSPIVVVPGFIACNTGLPLSPDRFIDGEYVNNTYPCGLLVVVTLSALGVNVYGGVSAQISPTGQDADWWPVGAWALLNLSDPNVRAMGTITFVVPYDPESPWHYKCIRTGGNIELQNWIEYPLLAAYNYYAK